MSSETFKEIPATVDLSLQDDKENITPPNSGEVQGEMVSAKKKNLVIIC